MICPYCGTTMVHERPEDPEPETDGVVSRPPVGSDEEMEPIVESTDLPDVLTEARDPTVQAIQHAGHHHGHRRGYVLPVDAGNDGIETGEHRRSGQRVGQQENTSVHFFVVGFHRSVCRIKTGRNHTINALADTLHALGVPWPATAPESSHGRRFYAINWFQTTDWCEP